MREKDREFSPRGGSLMGERGILLTPDDQKGRKGVRAVVVLGHGRLAVVYSHEGRHICGGLALFLAGDNGRYGAEDEWLRAL